MGPVVTRTYVKSSWTDFTAYFGGLKQLLWLFSRFHPRGALFPRSGMLLCDESFVGGNKNKIAKSFDITHSV